MKGKILHITWGMSIGGAEKAIYQLIKGQRQAGIEADFLAASKILFYKAELEQLGARALELGQRNGWDWSIRRKFLELIGDYEIVHFHFCSPLLMYFASRNRNLRLFYTQRSGCLQFSLKGILIRKFCGFLLRHKFSAISGNTKHAARAAARLFKIPLKKIAVTYNGIDFSLLEPARSRGDILRELDGGGNNIIRVGTNANIREWKRIDYLLKAAFQLDDIPLRYYIIGDGPFKKKLEELCDNLGLKEKVVFTGSKEHIADYLQALDIFVLPSSNNESFGNSAVEAMAMGIPVIVMKDGGGLLEHITGGGGLVAKDIDGLVMFIKQLSRSAGMRYRIGETGKTYVSSKYTIGNMVNAYNRLYSGPH